MTQGRLATIKKAVLFAVLVILLLAAVVVVSLYKPAGKDKDFININQLWTDEKMEYIGEFGFDYSTDEVETHSFPVLLGADSRIVVEELDPESSPCRLSLYLDREQVWWTPINAGEEYRPEVQPGRYELVLGMANGAGKGYVVIEN